MHGRLHGPVGAGRHGARHEPGRGRSPDPRVAGQLLGATSITSCRTGSERRGVDRLRQRLRRSGQASTSRSMIIGGFLRVLAGRRLVRRLRDIADSKSVRTCSSTWHTWPGWSRPANIRARCQIADVVTTTTTHKTLQRPARRPDSRPQERRADQEIQFARSFRARRADR